METRSVIKMTVLVGLITTLAWPPSGLALAHSESPPGTATSGHGAETSGPDGVIGVALHVGAERVGDPAVLYIAQIYPDGPAQQPGLKQGDELVTVDGQAVTGKTYEQVASMIRGEAGSVVKLGVKRDGEVRDITVARVSSQTLYGCPRMKAGWRWSSST
ncbi:MAG: hypothetical protein NBKEAIPA_00932 [Nitrospirae bacterium]|nr:hypothetical protein [Nitrospirota bacterium]MCK6494563.1 PDZ domain-containing protein [Nitrospira sp.]MCK6500493.1 PDZ domain-containing protein [Nitrospira sp.]MEB2338118.1 PDZ domain-containing protein [Nitrospirales bacterium]QOJ35327.1 MAG: PDZ domain-containing protein [Nitrospira sp.]